MNISLIIPTFNERRRMLACLNELRALPVHELIVVDGHSPDGSAQLARSQVAGYPKPLTVLASPAGRARQMNLGAAHAQGDVLWFLHADVGLPANAVELVQQVLAQPRNIAGAFKTHTQVDTDFTPHNWWQRHAPLWLRLADVRSRYTRLPYGDQALFVRRQAFEHVGGFPDIALMEDLELSLRLRRLGNIARVDAQVRVSGRRFLEHPLVDTALVNLFPLAYRCGVPPRALATLYRNTR